MTNLNETPPRGGETIALGALSSAVDFEAALRELHERPVLLFKHSRACPLLLFTLLVLSACKSSIAPSTDLVGTWAVNFSVPGASLIVTLDQTGNGTGTYAIEAGRSGTVQVTGTFTRPMITLVIRYDYGLVRSFEGTLIDANHITGSFADTSGMLTFARR